MVDRIHQKLGTAGFVIAIVALIAALGGGAYAASGGFSAKQKEEIRRIAKQFTGKPGEPGATGSPGANGKNGLDGLGGENGEPGEAGVRGKSVLVGETAPGCAAGGITVEIEGSGEAHEVCNGEKGDNGDNGEPWTAGGTLPEGSTETGSWSMGAVPTAPESFISEPIFAPLSFTIPISAPLAGAKVHYINPAGEEVVGLGVTQPPTTCTGEAASPTAPGGELCVYATLEQGASETKLAFGGIQPIASAEFLGESGASTAGAALKFFVLQKGVFAYGTFAVTG